MRPVTPARMAIVYHLSAPDPDTHRLAVRATFPGGPAEIVFPAWAPGSYLMREFGRNARDVRAWAADGGPVGLERLDRNRWRVDHPGPFTVAYEVYCREKSVRTPFVDAELVFFLPSNVLVYDPDRRHDGFVIEIDVPPGQTGVCPLGPEVEGPARARWEAADLDALMDAPVSIAAFQHTSFTLDGVVHHHWVEPGHNGDIAKMNEDFRRIVAAARATVGGAFPYRRYDFVTLHLQKGHGGLEHKDCSVLLKSRLGYRDSKGYEDFVALAAHEHFHAWNVKRIHPAALGPRFDYDREHYTPDLWWLEGGTVYYEERVLYRAGVVAEERHLARLAELAERLQKTPGRRHQPLEESSLEAWIKLYRPGEDTVNSGISYYLKGAVVLWAMDLELLARTDGERGVDDLLRALWEGWGRQGVGYPAGTLRRLAAELAGGGGDWDRWWDHHLRGTGEVALAPALDHAGYDLVWGKPGDAGWLGVDLGGGERVTVEAVREDGPAYGVLSPGDELLALDGHRVLAASLADRLKDAPAGTPLRVLLARDGRVLERRMVTAPSPRADLKVVGRSAMDDRRKRIRERWLDRSRFGS